MPSSKEYMKEYREKNKEKLLQQSREYYKKNKERKLERMKQYQKNNELYFKEYLREYHINNPLIYKTNKWKEQGIKLRMNEDWESVYLFYITCEECEECNVKLTDEKINTSTRRCLDHDHSTGFIRNILCHSCNVRRG